MTDYRNEIYERYASYHVRSEQQNTDARAKAAALLRRRFWRWLPADKDVSILDLGCGDGTVLSWLQQEGYAHLTGVDASPEQVQRARQVWAEVRQADALAFLQGCHEQYDLIIALDVIEHFRLDEVLHLLRACCQALRPGGRLLLQTINGDSPFYAHILYGDPTHQTAYTTRSLETLLRVAGFQRVEFASLGPVAHGPVSALRWLLWHLMCLALAAYHLIEMGTTGKAIFTQCFAACARK